MGHCSFTKNFYCLRISYTDVTWYLNKPTPLSPIRFLPSTTHNAFPFQVNVLKKKKSSCNPLGAACTYSGVGPFPEAWGYLRGRLSLGFLMYDSEILTEKIACHNCPILIRSAIMLRKPLLRQSPSDLCYTALAFNVSNQGNCIKLHTSNDSCFRQYQDIDAS